MRDAIVHRQAIGVALLGVVVVLLVIRECAAEFAAPRRKTAILTVLSGTSFLLLCALVITRFVVIAD